MTDSILDFIVVVLYGLAALGFGFTMGFDIGHGFGFYEGQYEAIKLESYSQNN